MERDFNQVKTYQKKRAFLERHPVFRFLKGALLPKTLSHHSWIDTGVAISSTNGFWNIAGVRALSYSEFKEKFSREYVVIVASGPSFSMKTLATEPKEALMISVNGSYNLFEKEGPDLLIITDRNYCRANVNQIHESAEKGVTLVVTLAVASLLIKQKKLPEKSFFIIEFINEWYGVGKVPLDSIEISDLLFPGKRESNKIGFSMDCSKGVFSGATVSYIALQVAYSLGGQKVSFHGLDLGGKGRAYKEETPQGSQLDQHFEPYIKPTFLFARSVLERKGLTLRNHSESCPIDLNLP